MDTFAKLESVGRGEVSASEAVKAVTQVIENNDIMALGRAYNATRDLTWRYIRETQSFDEAKTWSNGLGLIAVLFDENGSPELTKRLQGMHELLHKSLDMAYVEEAA